MIINGEIINPGDLRNKVTLARRTVSVETGGFQSRGTETVADVWAKWVNAHGGEVWESQTVHAVSPATVTIRYRADVDSTWLVVKNGIEYEIVGMDDIQNRHEYLALTVQQLTKAG